MTTQTALAGLPLDEALHLPIPTLRRLLEDQWREDVTEITRLSVELHEPGAKGDVLDDGSRTDRVLVTARLLAARRHALEETEAALARLDAGRFGTCQHCSATIPFERLEVLPATRYCVGCGTRRSRR